MEVVRFYAVVVKIALLLALCGQLKACTLELAGRAVAKRGMMSYSRYTKALLKR